MLLYPEGMVKLNQSAAAILTRCDGRRTVADIVDGPRAHVRPHRADAGRLRVRRPRSGADAGWSCPRERSDARAGLAARRWLRTARSAALAAGRAHLSLPAALRVLLQPDRLRQRRPRARDRGLAARSRGGAALGSVQLGLSGGEPLVRDDLETIVAAAHRLGFYTNLITSGVGLTEPRLQALQGQRPGSHPALLPGQHARDERLPEQHANLRAEVAGGDAHQEASTTRWSSTWCCIGSTSITWKRSSAWPSAWAPTTSSSPTPSTTVGRGAIAEQLLPTPRAAAARGSRHRPLQRARGLAHARLLRGARLLRDAAETLHERPRTGVPRHRAGWRRTTLPGGADATGPRPSRAYARRACARIWYDSPAFNHYRGEDWMKEPCRSCPERSRDFGGCRCQAYLLTGDAANADPVCDLSPHHHLVTAAVDRARASRRRPRALPSIRSIFRDHRTRNVGG